MHIELWSRSFFLMCCDNLKFYLVKFWVNHYNNIYWIFTLNQALCQTFIITILFDFHNKQHLFLRWRNRTSIRGTVSSFYLSDAQRILKSKMWIWSCLCLEKKNIHFRVFPYNKALHSWSAHFPNLPHSSYYWTY